MEDPFKIKVDMHTPGKIKIERYDVRGVIVDPVDPTDNGGVHICAVGGRNNYSNARRIVAAWNACDGLETELLETLPLNFKAHALQCADLRTKNAALLEAIKEMERMLPVLNRLTRDNEQAWERAATGTGIATLNSYRAMLEKALEAVKNDNP